ncbi:MAG TPA: hypothetical protein DCW74_12790 [Alteromonas australica]|uniref:Uncharacterized protein n=1 Tax=Alteromonas australica TaxID=589873 RepID=A0A350P5N0_9ALTE|nr:hypothetical protein [Alteromonas australica]
MASLVVEASKNRGDTEKAIANLLNRTLLQIAEQLSIQEIQSDVEQSLEIEKETIRARDFLAMHFSSIGIRHELPEIFFVENFPAPLEKSGHVAITFDKSDEREFGITPGIYFRKNSTRPYLSVLTLCHEYIHVVLNRFDDGSIGTPLEEGIAVLYGELYLFSKLFDSNLSLTAYSFNRIATRNIKGLDAYLDYARLALPLALSGGTRPFEEILLSGRERLGQSEANLWANHFPHQLTYDGNDDSFVRSAIFATSVLGKTNFSTPEACWLMNFIKPEISFEELSAHSGLSMEGTKRAVDALSGTPRLVISNDEKVVHSICKQVSHPSQLRFQIPEDLSPLGSTR